MKINWNILALNNYYSNIYKLSYSKKLYNYGLIITTFIFKKEKIYTKLKYSRVPQVDYVSGGVASLLAGLLGFLVTEKFGFELIDSLDFYILLYYIIILLLITRIFYKTFLIFGLKSIIFIYIKFFKLFLICLKLIKFL